MTDDLQKILELIDGVLDLEPPERLAWLERHCDDPDLRRRVLERVAAAESGVGGLHGSAAEHAADLVANAGDDRLIGEKLGPFLVEDRIGSGGMGVVYLARRDDEQFDQRVVIKRVRRAAASTALIQRFLQERQILARLDHPSIARLVDGGVDDESVPWLAMEYVDGVPIDEFCASRPVEERLDLFREVCAAVAAAHRNLVVHRDIKPSNVLVTAEGHVKLLDFGVAKLIDDDPTNSELTHIGPAPMTPEYASPEQVREEPITTASDVYQLGLLLYRMLTGENAQRATTSKLVELQREVLETRPELPSVAAGAGAGRRLRGDLDTIVMFALNKDPARRYESASAMAADVLLHLQGRPIAARADSLGYRTGRFMARNPIAITSTLVILALLGWIAVSSVLQARSLRVERDRAQLEAHNAEEVANFLIDLFQQSDPDVAAGEDPTARELLARGAERIETELADQPATQIRLMRTIAEIEAELGNFESAHELLDRALARALPVLGLANEETGLIALRLGELHGDEGSFGAADSILVVAESIYERVDPPMPGSVAQVLTQRAQIAKEVGNFDLADSLYVRSLDFERAVVPVDSVNLSLTLNNYGEMLRARGRTDEAEAPLREALAIRRAVFGDESVRVASTLNNLALVLKRQGKLDEALEIFEQILVVDRKILGDEHRYIGMDINNLATTLQAMGRNEEALERHREALALRRRIFEGPHPDTAVSLNNIGTTFRELGQLDSAQIYYGQALEINEAVFGDDHPRIAATMKSIASIWMERGDYDQALEVQTGALSMRRRVFGDAHPAVASDLLAARSNPGRARAFRRGAGRHRRGEEHRRDCFARGQRAACGNLRPPLRTG